MAKRPFGKGGSRKSKNRRTRKNRTSPKNNLTTNGGEYTLDGKDYVGDYHIMDDGRAMTGKRHKGRGLFGLRRKKKRYLIKKQKIHWMYQNYWELNARIQQMKKI